MLIDPGGSSQRGPYQSTDSLPASPPAPAATVKPASSATTAATAASPTSSSPPPDSVTLRHCELPNQNQGASAAAPQPASEPNTGEKLKRILDSDPGWSTLLAAAHAAYTAPNEIVSKFEEAAQSKRNVATALDHLVAKWSETSPDDHASAAANLLKLEDTPDVARAVRVIAQANALPKRVADTLTSWSHGNGLQRLAARAGDSPPGKWLFNHSVNTLSAEAKGQLGDIQSRSLSVEKELLAQAAAKGGNRPFLHKLSTTVEDVGGEGGKLDGPLGNALADVPVLKNIPVVGLGISTLAAAYDIGFDHENPIEAVSKEYGGLGAGQLAYDATLSAFRSGASTGAGTGADVAAGAASDGAASAATDVAAGAAGDGALGGGAELAGEAALTIGGPGTLAVAVGVGAAVAVGFAATKFIEGGGHDFGDAVTQGGGKIVSGIAHGNIGEVGTGFKDGAKDTLKGLEDGGASVVQGFKSVGSAIGSIL